MRALMIATLMSLVACSPQAATEPAQASSSAAQPGVHPESGLQVIPLTVDSANGRHTFQVEVAATPAEQAQGLMFRRQLGPDEGMIFPREDNPRIASFWMKNTVLPLDLIFIGPDRKIINIAANAEPYSEDPILSDAPAANVLELIGGRAAELGLAPGDSVEW